MPLDTWTKNRHLFVNDFKTTEWESLNEFYDKCSMFDEAIRHNDARFAKDEQQIRESVHRTTYDLTYDMFKNFNQNTTDDKEEEYKVSFFEKRNKMAKFLTTGENLWLYTPSKEMKDVESLISSVNYNLSISSVGTKLSKLSRRRITFNMHKQ